MVLRVKKCILKVIIFSLVSVSIPAQAGFWDSISAFFSTTKGKISAVLGIAALAGASYWYWKTKNKNSNNIPVVEISPKKTLAKTYAKPFTEDFDQLLKKSNAWFHNNNNDKNPFWENQYVVQVIDMLKRIDGELSNNYKDDLGRLLYCVICYVESEIRFKETLDPIKKEIIEEILKLPCNINVKIRDLDLSILQFMLDNINEIYLHRKNSFCQTYRSFLIYIIEKLLSRNDIAISLLEANKPILHCAVELCDERLVNLACEKGDPEALFVGENVLDECARNLRWITRYYNCKHDCITIIKLLLSKYPKNYAFRWSTLYQLCRWVAFNSYDFGLLYQLIECAAHADKNNSYAFHIDELPENNMGIVCLLEIYKANFMKLNKVFFKIHNKNQQNLFCHFLKQYFNYVQTLEEKLNIAQFFYQTLKDPSLFMFLLSSPDFKSQQIDLSQFMIVAVDENQYEGDQKMKSEVVQKKPQLKGLASLVTNFLIETDTQKLCLIDHPIQGLERASDQLLGMECADPLFEFNSSWLYAYTLISKTLSRNDLDTQRNNLGPTARIIAERIISFANALGQKIIDNPNPTNQALFGRIFRQSIRLIINLNKKGLIPDTIRKSALIDLVGLGRDIQSALI